MTDKQFRTIESLLISLEAYARLAQRDTEWCIERMKRIDRDEAQRKSQAVLDRAQYRRDSKLNTDRIAELRAREAARDKADRNALKDAFIRAGLWDEMVENLTLFHNFHKDDAKG